MKAGGNSHPDDYPITPGWGGSGGSSYLNKPDGHAITVSRMQIKHGVSGEETITINETFAISELPAKTIVATKNGQYLVTVEKYIEGNGLKHDSIQFDEMK